jgi:hypothetical protein
MLGRALGIAIAILVVAAGGLRLTSAGAEPSIPAVPPPTGIPPFAVAAVPPSPPLAVAVAESGGSSARPPQEDEGARARREIDRTERVLTAVRKKVLRSYNRKAKQDFEAAAQRQREARGSLQESFFARADRLTREARSMARHVAFRLGPPQDDPDYVAMTLARTDDALQRAKEILSNAGGPDERQRWDDLDAGQREARDLYKQRRIRAAYEATREVRDGVLTLLRDCDDLPVPPDTAERALKRAARALEISKSELGDRPSSAARRLEREARAQLESRRNQTNKSIQTRDGNIF